MTDPNDAAGLSSRGGTALEVRDVDAFYGRSKVLDRISLNVGAGEFVAMLGSSGCGKTTLLRAICGFVPVAGGAILVNGRDVTHLPPDQRDAAMVFQSYALWPHMNVAQNLGYGLRLRGVNKARIAERVSTMLDLLRLKGLGERRITELSGGQRQRVALGRALAISPQLLLLDEPLSNLDARVREEVRHEIKTLQRDLGITTVHVTHDREEAMVMADRIAILDAGRVVQIGAPEELYNRPNSPFVARFMGAGNRIRLVVGSEAGGLTLSDGSADRAVAVPAGSPALDRLGAGATGSVTAYFRSTDARLLPGDDPQTGDLHLPGIIEQQAYPGGCFRYAVRVGDEQLIVDDSHRLAVGSTIGVALPLSALHIYPDEAPFP